MEKINKRKIVYISIPLLLFILIIGLYVFLNSKRNDSNVNSVQDNLSAEIINEYIVGSYTAVYTLDSEEEDMFRLRIRVSNENNIVLDGRLPNGRPFSIFGEIDSEGSFVAEGFVRGTPDEVSFEGSFIVDNETNTTTGSGTWETESMSGTWSAQKR